MPLATEWAAKNPAVSTTRPATMAASEDGRVRATPLMATTTPATSTPRRPALSASRPAVGVGAGTLDPLQAVEVEAVAVT